MMCPVSKGIVCGEGCAWLNKETGNCAVLDIADKLAYLAAMREPMEKLLQALTLEAENRLVEAEPHT